MHRLAAILLLLAALASAETVIGEVDRPWFFEGRYRDGSLPMEVRFAKDKGLPADITGFNINEAVHTYARANGGKWEKLKGSGWTRAMLLVWVPTTLLAKQGKLEVMVTVHGVETKLFALPIQPPPSKLPEILSVRPGQIDLTDGSEAVSFTVEYRQPDEWGFVSVRLNGRGCAIGRTDLEGDGRGRVVAWVAKELLTKNALYEVTVTTRAGASEAAELRIGKEPIKLREAPKRPLRPEPKGPVAMPGEPGTRLAVHGNSLLVESEHRLLRVLRQGGRGRVEFTPGTKDAKGEETLWVHFSPALTLPARITGTSVRLQAGTGVSVRHVHVWDGSRRILNEDRDARRAMNGSVTVTLPGPVAIVEGITISIGIIVPRNATADLWVDFSSVAVLLAE